MVIYHPGPAFRQVHVSGVGEGDEYVLAEPALPGPVPVPAAAPGTVVARLAPPGPHGHGVVLAHRDRHGVLVHTCYTGLPVAPCCERGERVAAGAPVCWIARPVAPAPRHLRVAVHAPARAGQPGGQGAHHADPAWFNLAGLTYPDALLAALVGPPPAVSLDAVRAADLGDVPLRAAAEGDVIAYRLTPAPTVGEAPAWLADCLVRHPQGTGLRYTLYQGVGLAPAPAPPCHPVSRPVTLYPALPTRQFTPTGWSLVPGDVLTPLSTPAPALGWVAARGEEPYVPVALLRSSVPRVPLAWRPFWVAAAWLPPPAPPLPAVRWLCTRVHAVLREAQVTFADPVGYGPSGHERAGPPGRVLPAGTQVVFEVDALAQQWQGDALIDVARAQVWPARHGVWLPLRAEALQWTVGPLPASEGWRVPRQGRWVGAGEVMGYVRSPAPAAEVALPAAPVLVAREESNVPGPVPEAGAPEGEAAWRTLPARLRAQLGPSPRWRVAPGPAAPEVDRDDAHRSWSARIAGGHSLAGAVRALPVTHNTDLAGLLTWMAQPQGRASPEAPTRFHYGLDARGAGGVTLVMAPLVATIPGAQVHDVHQQAPYLLGRPPSPPGALPDEVAHALLAAVCAHADFRQHQLRAHGHALCPLPQLARLPAAQRHALMATRCRLGLFNPALVVPTLAGLPLLEAVALVLIAAPVHRAWAHGTPLLASAAAEARARLCYADWLANGRVVVVETGAAPLWAHGQDQAPGGAGGHDGLMRAVRLGLEAHPDYVPGCLAPSPAAYSLPAFTALEQAYFHHLLACGALGADDASPRGLAGTPMEVRDGQQTL